MPARIQRRRVKGYRMPVGALYVGRPSRWGNPFTIERVRMNLHHCVEWPGLRATPLSAVYYPLRAPADGGFVGDVAPAVAVDLFQALAMRFRRTDARGFEAWIKPLRGRDLACWCPLDRACHAEVLLDLANREVQGSGIGDQGSAARVGSAGVGRRAAGATKDPRPAATKGNR